MIKKLIFIPGIGNITLEIKARQKTLRLRIHPDRGVFVSVPRYVSENQAKKFVAENAEWIKEKLSKIERNKDKGIFTEDSFFKTRKHELFLRRLDDSGTGKSYAEVKDGIINLYFSEAVNFQNQNTQTIIQKVILQTLWIEAVEFLPERIERIAKSHGFKYSGLKIGKAQKTWGSCKSDNSINLSAKLMLLPDELIDYIILHELCHTKFKNHSAKFYELLNLHCGGKVKFYNAELKKIGSKIVPGDYSYAK